MNQFPKSLAAALFKAQGKMRGVSKDKTNPHYRSSYATLENVTDTIRPVLQECGVLFMQAPGPVDEHGVFYVDTHLIHAESGEMFTSRIGVPLVKRDPQSIGSATTYACRYSLMALLGLPPVDDDGESAGRAETITPLKVLSKKDAGSLYKELETELRACVGAAAIKRWAASAEVKNRVAQLPADWADSLRTERADLLAATDVE